MLKLSVDINTSPSERSVKFVINAELQFDVIWIFILNGVKWFLT